MNWKSPNFNAKSGKFQNLEMAPIAMMNRPRNLFKMTFEVVFRNSEYRYPKKPIPYVKADLKSFYQNQSQDQLIWMGHSSILMSVNGKSILIDPVFYQASPVPGVVRRYGPNPFFPKDLPPIDILLLSHDHYDHLDARAFSELNLSTTQILTPLGVKERLIKLNIPREQITELDWWQSCVLAGINFTFAPAQHFSGRNLNDRDRTLWGSWCIHGKLNKYFFSGDSGYNSHFKEIGNRLGPFHVAMVETGQYNSLWTAVHMLPEQSVQATVDLKSDFMLPIHWGAYSLSTHAWNDPAYRAMKAGAEKNQKIILPQMGELLKLSELKNGTEWVSQNPDWWK